MSGGQKIEYPPHLREILERALKDTRSGKIMRRLIKAVITGQPLGDYSTIEDEGSLEEIRKAAEALISGMKKKS